MKENDSDIIKEVQLQKEMEKKLALKNKLNPPQSFQSYLEDFRKTKVLSTRSRQNSFKDRKDSVASRKSKKKSEKKKSSQRKRTEIRLQLPMRINDDMDYSDAYSEDSNQNSSNRKIKLEINSSNKRLLLVLQNKKKKKNKNKYMTPQPTTHVQLNHADMNFLDDGSEEEREIATFQSKRTIKKKSRTRQRNLTATDFGNGVVHKERKRPPLGNRKNIQIEKLKDKGVFVSYNDEKGEMLVCVNETSDSKTDKEQVSRISTDSMNMNIPKYKDQENNSIFTSNISTGKRFGLQKKLSGTSKNSGLTEQSILSSPNKLLRNKEMEKRPKNQSNRRGRDNNRAFLSKLTLNDEPKSEQPKYSKDSGVYTADNKRKKIKFFDAGVFQNQNNDDFDFD